MQDQMSVQCIYRANEPKGCNIENKLMKIFWIIVKDSDF